MFSQTIGKNCLMTHFRVRKKKWKKQKKIGKETKQQNQHL